jgi:hypothetical protein
MAEGIQNAWSGWLQFTDAGKLAALLAAALGYLFWNRKQKGPQRRALLYCGIAAALCMFPVTAAVFMWYQTEFYDYAWIWSMVPVTAVIALGGTCFLTEQWKQGQGYRILLHNGVLTLLLIGVLALCGGLGGNTVPSSQAWADDAQFSPAGGTSMGAVLSKVQEVCGAECCLWAPREILESVRAQDGSIRLLYGRNMWDVALDAYSYDVYSEEQREMYLWMETLAEVVEAAAESDVTDGTSAADGLDADWRADYLDYVQKAQQMGVDCILLPAGSESLIDLAETPESVEVVRLDDYYLLKMR